MKSLFKKIFSDDHQIVTNTVFFVMLLMLLYVLILLPFIIFFFVQNPNMFQEAESEIYLNKNELYQMGSSLELYGGFITAGAICELVRRARSLKISIFSDTLFVSYLCILAGQACDILGYIFMLTN